MMRDSVLILVHGRHAPGAGVVRLYTLCLKVCYYVCCYTLENLCYILTTLGARFEELKTVLLRQGLPSR